MELKIGDNVRKVKGYKYFGVIVAKFFTTSGHLRFVVENIGENKGMLFIFNADQLELNE